MQYYLHQLPRGGLSFVDTEGMQELLEVDIPFYFQQLPLMAMTSLREQLLGYIILMQEESDLIWPVPMEHLAFTIRHPMTVHLEIDDGETLGWHFATMLAMGLGSQRPTNFDRIYAEFLFWVRPFTIRPRMPWRRPWVERPCADSLGPCADSLGSVSLSGMSRTLFKESPRHCTGRASSDVQKRPPRAYRWWRFPMAQKPIEIGDQVLYSAKFLRSIGMFAGNDPLMHRSMGGGTVEAIEPLGSQTKIAVIRTKGGEERRVNVANLIRFGQLEAD